MRGLLTGSFQVLSEECGLGILETSLKGALSCDASSSLPSREAPCQVGRAVPGPEPPLASFPTIVPNVMGSRHPQLMLTLLGSGGQETVAFPTVGS